MLHSLLVVLFLAQVTPVGLWKTDRDPFTDESRLILSGVGKMGELKLGVGCNEDGFTFQFLFENFRSRQSFKWMKIRFDDGPIEHFSTFPLQGMIWLGFKYDGDRALVTDDADVLALRLADHTRLRVDLMAENPRRRVVDDFDISKVTVELLSFMLDTECTLEPSP